MRYALIADVHGNLHGMEAVLRDAENQGVDRLIFLGDLIGDFPLVNECAARLRAYPGAVCIRGNKEDYFHELRAMDTTGCVSEQYAPILYSFQELRADNLAWLDGLPAALRIEDEDAGPMTLRHRLRDMIGKTSLKVLTSSNFARQMDETPFTHEEYLTHAQALVDREEAIAALPAGAYLFGDSHVQWHARRGGALLVNPGSCGLPLDCDPRAKYTLIESSRGAWHVTERQIPYDVEAALDALLASEMYALSPVWGRLNHHKLRTGVDRLYMYFEEVAKLSDQPGSIARPHSDVDWRQAGETVLRRIGEMGI